MGPSWCSERAPSLGGGVGALPAKADCQDLRFSATRPWWVMLCSHAGSLDRRRSRLDMRRLSRLAMACGRADGAAVEGGADERPRIAIPTSQLDQQHAARVRSVTVHVVCCVHESRLGTFPRTLTEQLTEQRGWKTPHAAGGRVTAS